MAESLRVEAEARLLEFLRRSLPRWKRKTLEQRLAAGCVQVNGASVVRPHHEVHPGDVVLVLPEGEGLLPRKAPAGFVVLHADEELVAIDKPAGLLSVPLDGRQGRSALSLVRDWLSSPGRPARVWPVHRLDRESSGVLLLALSTAAHEALQESWSEAQKTYLAVVEGRPEPPQGVIEQPLWEDAALNVHVGKRAEAEEARTRYSTLRTQGERSLLEVELDSGRRHQIRAHLAWLGHPIVGDPRYGSAGPRMGLHARRLEVTHPARLERIAFEAPVPPEFESLMR